MKTHDVCEMYKDRLGKAVFFKARPRTNTSYCIARSIARMLNLDKSKPYGTFFITVKNGEDPILVIQRRKQKVIEKRWLKDPLGAI